MPAGVGCAQNPEAFLFRDSRGILH